MQNALKSKCRLFNKVKTLIALLKLCLQDSIQYSISPPISSAVIFFIKGMSGRKKLYGDCERRYKNSDVDETNESREIYIENNEIVRLVLKS